MVYSSLTTSLFALWLGRRCTKERRRRATYHALRAAAHKARYRSSPLYSPILPLLTATRLLPSVPPRWTTLWSLRLRVRTSLDVRKVLWLDMVPRTQLSRMTPAQTARGLRSGSSTRTRARGNANTQIGEKRAEQHHLRHLQHAALLHPTPTVLYNIMPPIYVCRRWAFRLRSRFTAAASFCLFIIVLSATTSIS